MTLQLATVIAIIAAAVAYAARRICRALRHADDPCQGCKLANKGCQKKKRDQKFGCSK